MNSTRNKETLYCHWFSTLF